MFVEERGPMGAEVERPLEDMDSLALVQEIEHSGAKGQLPR
ncbi:MAG: hypothetical protein ABW194_11175 [Novosphingobium sp.]